MESEAKEKNMFQKSKEDQLEYTKYSVSDKILTWAMSYIYSDNIIRDKVLQSHHGNRKFIDTCKEIYRESRLYLLIICQLTFPCTMATLQVELLPRNPTYFAGSTAAFTCTAQGAVTVHWYLNGKLQNSTETSFSTILGIGILRINQISKTYNRTQVQCAGVFSDTSTWRSLTSYILIQGRLDPVAHLQYSIFKYQISVLWTAPYSLSVPDSGENNGISYCVDIYNSTDLERVYSKCNINNTHHTCESFPDLVACATSSISVKAVNPVGNSTGNTIQAWYGGIGELNVNRTIQTESMTNFEIETDRIFCLQNTSLMVDNKTIPFIGVESNIITFNLPSNNHYNDVFLIFKANGFNDTKDLGSIQTYDVHNITVNSNKKNCVSLQASFYPNSKAVGVMYILVHYNEGKVNFSKSVFLPVKKKDAQNGVNIKEISNGSYTVLAYDIEQNGHLQDSGLPSNTESVIVKGSISVKNIIDVSQHCNITIIQLTVSVTCFCNITNYYYVLLQKYNGSLESILNITTASSKCSEFVFIPVEYGNNYQVTIFHGDNANDITNTTVYNTKLITVMMSGPDLKHIQENTEVTPESQRDNTIIALIITSVIVIIVILIVTVAIVFLAFKKRKASKEKQDNITVLSYQNSHSINPTKEETKAEETNDTSTDYSCSVEETTSIQTNDDSCIDQWKENEAATSLETPKTTPAMNLRARKVITKHSSENLESSPKEKKHKKLCRMKSAEVQLPHQNDAKIRRFTSEMLYPEKYDIIFIKDLLDIK